MTIKAAVIITLALLLMGSGCITASKDLYREMTATPEPTPTPEPVVITTLTPEPTPPQVIAIYGEPMLPGQFVSWRRDNVSGYKDLTMHATIYGYRMLQSVEWWSVSWGQYYVQTAPPGKKFLFVFAHTYSDEGSARTWGIQDSQFSVAINGETYRPSDELLPQVRIKEFDEIWDLDHVWNIRPYGYLRVIDRGKERVEALGFLKCGRSNAWSGYIVYIVPEDTKPEDVRVLARLNNMLTAEWRLVE